MNRSRRLLTKFAFVFFICAAGLCGTAVSWGQLSPAVSGLKADATGATFTIPARDLHDPPSFIAYGDVRFTDSANTTTTYPEVRRALVARIASEKPDGVLITGDLPWRGVQSDYSVYRQETHAWRERQLRIFPALGNHELALCASQCLENWWAAFPELDHRLWYSAALGTRVYVIVLDSNSPLQEGSRQGQWLGEQIASLSPSVQFVLIAMHHPPVADIQTRLVVDHNPRPNEIAVADLLNRMQAGSRAKFIVISGHIHNYERFVKDDVVYLISGGGGALPYPVERTSADLYQDPSFPNYHYIKFELTGDTLHGTMNRLADPHANVWEVKDTFDIRAKSPAH